MHRQNCILNRWYYVTLYGAYIGKIQTTEKELYSALKESGADVVSFSPNGEVKAYR